MDSCKTCPACGAELELVGVTASIRQTVMFMGNIGEPGMRRVSTVGQTEVDQVQCRQCLAVLPVKWAEGLIPA